MHKSHHPMTSMTLLHVAVRLCVLVPPPGILPLTSNSHLSLRTFLNHFSKPQSIHLFFQTVQYVTYYQSSYRQSRQMTEDSASNRISSRPEVSFTNCPSSKSSSYIFQLHNFLSTAAAARKHDNYYNGGSGYSGAGFDEQAEQGAGGARRK